MSGSTELNDLRAKIVTLADRVVQLEHFADNVSQWIKDHDQKDKDDDTLLLPIAKRLSPPQGYTTQRKKA